MEDFFRDRMRRLTPVFIQDIEGMPAADPDDVAAFGWRFFRAGTPAFRAAVLAMILALLRPLGRSLEAWAYLGLRYLALPKRAVWRCAILDPVIDAQGEEGWAEWSPALAWSEEAV